MNDPTTIPCDRRIIDGRFRKADQFFEAAETIREFAGEEAEIGDAYVDRAPRSRVRRGDELARRRAEDELIA